MNNRKGSKNWAIEEMNYMYFNWGNFSIKQFARKFNRTEIAILIKSKRMRLGSPYKSRTRFSANQVADIMGVDIHAVTDYWIKKLGLKSYKKAYRNKQFHLINFDDLMSWLEKNQGKWDSRRFKRFALKIEPEWLRQKRILDSYEPKRKNQKYSRLEDLKLMDLYYRQGKDYKEIAKIMERSFDSVERRLSRIRPYKKVGKLQLIK